MSGMVRDWKATGLISLTDPIISGHVRLRYSTLADGTGVVPSVPAPPARGSLRIALAELNRVRAAGMVPPPSRRPHEASLDFRIDSPGGKRPLDQGNSQWLRLSSPAQMLPSGSREQRPQDPVEASGVCGGKAESGPAC